MLTVKQTLTAARNGITKSRGASLRAKTFMDAGYSNVRNRDAAVEELRQSVEQLIEVVEYLIDEGDTGQRLLADKTDLLPKNVVPEVESDIEERRRRA